LSDSYPLITIGMTCYNAKDTIERAIRSAMAQDWPHFEIVIVDDCSTDGSATVIQKITKDCSVARLVCHDANKGPAGARNTILAHAKGEFVAFFDDDDESLPERLTSQYQRLTFYESEADTKLVACYASGHRHYPNNYIMKIQAIGSSPVVPYGPAMADYLLFYRKKSGWCYGGTPTCSLMARHSTFETAGGFDENFRRVEDIDFAVRLALAGGHFVGCVESLFIQHSTTAGDKSPQMNLEAELKLVEKHKEHLLSVHYYSYARLWPYLRYYHFIGDYWRMGLTFLKLLPDHPIKAICHILDTGPRRLRHEYKMSKGTAS